MKRPRAFLLDMDGVIVDSMGHHALAWRTVLSEWGVEVSDHDVFLREGMSGRESIEDIFAEKGVPFPGDEAFAALQEKKHRLYEGFSIGLFPLAGKMVETLHASGCALALVTGSYLRSVRHVLPGDILSMFDAVVTAECVRRGKPDPEPYRKALELLDIGPDQAMVIENAPRGIESALRAGVVCVAIATTLPAPYLSGARAVFADHGECLRHLESLIGGIF